MTTIVVVLTIMLALTGVGISLWSLLNTRKKYYKEYTGRKRND